MYTKYPAVSLLVVLPMALSGQNAQENVVPLKNWATPLYWQPNQVEREAAAQAIPQKGGPQLVFSANQVSSNALTFIAITPCRLVDTRGGVFNGISPFSGPSIAPMTSATFPVQSPAEASANTAPAPCGTIPPIAQAYSLNLTVVPHAPYTVDYVTMWPATGTQPFVSTLDDPQGAIVSNAAIVPAGPTGSPYYGGISVFNAGPATTDVVIDMNGYFAAPSDLNFNTAIGLGALAGNTTGSDNTASGVNALQNNTMGNNNTASGSYALNLNTTGSDNTATGSGALQLNSTGIQNTASGYDALFANTSGLNNTASGVQALENNTTGNGNTATGVAALQSNTTGDLNIATGEGALGANTTGGFNIASGTNALTNNTTGNYNIAIGTDAAFNVSAGNSNNIHIGSQGSATDSGTIRIGTAAPSMICACGQQTSFFAAGISGVTTGLSGAVNVVVDANGQLGTISSSARFKEDIHDMDDASSGLLRLRPVTFRYKQPYSDGSKPLDYGLIAEEVAEVYPDLVVKDGNGQIQTLQYQKLTPMLLNELQKQAEQIRQQTAQNRQQTEQIHSLEDRLAALEALLSSQTATAARQGSRQ